MVRRTSILVLASLSLILWAVLWALLHRPGPPPLPPAHPPAIEAPFAEGLLSKPAPQREQAFGATAVEPQAAEETAPPAGEEKEELSFSGQVLERENRRPIAGASVHVKRGDSDLVVATDADGRFEIRSAPSPRAYLEVRAPGFGLALASLESPEPPMTILLGPAAELRFHLVGSDGAPVAGARLTVETEARNLSSSRMPVPDPSWSAETDAQGRCAIGDLPSDAPLQLEAAQAGRVLRRAVELVSLQPGEVREIEWHLGSGCRILGRVVDQEGVAAAGVQLWVVRADSEVPKFLTRYFEERVASRAKTDLSGRYEVPDVAAGRWWIGTAPSDARPGFAPLASVVDVPEGARELRHDFTVHRGLFIHGRVLDPSGEPREKGLVLGTSDEFSLHDSAPTDDQGRFAFGPLVPGRYTLTAFGDFEFADSEPVVATAGDVDVVLKLKPGSVLSGKVVDGMTGAPCAARLTFSCTSHADPSFLISRSQIDGTFRIEGLRSGTYDVVAHTDDSHIGYERDVSVGAGGLVVHVFEGARLRIRYAGKAHYGSFQILSDGVVIGVDSLENGASASQGVCAGHLVVKFTVFDPPRTQEKEIGLAVGEEGEIAFTDG